MKEKTIDCLFIGHNEMSFEEYEKNIKNMGRHSGAYRDLDLNFITFDHQPYTASEIFNLLSRDGKYRLPGSRPLSLGQCFSAAVAYLGTWLHRRDFSFDYVTSFQDQAVELSEKLEKENILAIAVITTFYVTALPILEIMDFIKKHNRTARIIIGGPFISTQVRTQQPDALEYLFNTIGADVYVNSSQGEATLVDVIDAFKKKRPLERVNNIYYSEDGRTGWISTPLLKEDNKLTENMVDWKLFSEGVGEFVALRTAVSCPFSCAFCGYPQHAGEYQTADVRAIENELNALGEIGKIKDIHFIDDTFNIPVKRFKEILRMMINRKFKFRWHSYFRCQYADEEMVELMKESGCEGVFLGIESGSDQILERMAKKVKVRDYRQGIALLKKYGIVTFGNFIIGFPGETHETARETIRFIKQGELDFFRAQLWYCEPITPIWRHRDTYRIKGEGFQWSHKTMDFKTACDIIDEIFLTVDNPVWVPLYNFDFDSIWHLVHSGMEIPEVKAFLKSFRDGVREKLRDPLQEETGYGVLSRLKSACTGAPVPGDVIGGESNVVDHTEAEFAF